MASPAQDNPETARRVPGYMRPTFASILPEYANAEADQIRRAFVGSNYSRLQKLPSKLSHQSVNAARFQQMDTNRLQARTTPIPVSTTPAKLFRSYEYSPSPFERADELAHLARRTADAQRLAISGKPFASGPAGARLKHEDAFGAQDFRYPHLQEPYPDTRDEERRQRIAEDKKVLHGAFVPSGNRPPVDAVTRKLLPELLHELHQALASDWPTLKLSVAPADDGMVVVRVEDASVECEPGLLAYMNVFVRSHRVASKYQLQKVAEDWNAKPGDGGLYFVLRPPWVRNRSKDLIVVVSAEGDAH